MWRNVMKPVRKKWIDIFLANKVQKWLHLFCGLKWEKQNQLSWPLVLLYSPFAALSLHPFCWPFCSRAHPLCYRPAKQVQKWNTNPDICSPFGCLFAWLLANIWNMLFAFHVTPMSFPHTFSEHQSVCHFFCLWFHHIPSQRIWHLSDNCSLTFLKNCLCAWSCPVGRHQSHGALRRELADRILMWVPALGIWQGWKWRAGLFQYCTRQSAGRCMVTKSDSVTMCETVWNWILDLAWWLHSTVAHPHIKRTRPQPP